MQTVVLCFQFISDNSFGKQTQQKGIVVPKQDHGSSQSETSTRPTYNPVDLTHLDDNVSVTDHNSLKNPVVSVQASTSAHSLLSGVYCYSVKLMNPLKKSDYVVRKLPATKKFTCVEELQSDLLSLFEDELFGQVSQVGYIEPGHGLRGKQCWLIKSEDWCDMYTSYEKKREILLWCIGQSKSDNKQKKFPLLQATTHLVSPLSLKNT